MKNTTHLFESLCIRKPYEWDECPLHRKLRTEQIEALLKLPTANTTSAPFDSFLSEDNQEYVVRVGERTFYVNTEGYNYARFAFEFPASILS